MSFNHTEESKRQMSELKKEYWKNRGKKNEDDRKYSIEREGDRILIKEMKRNLKKIYTKMMFSK